MQTEKNMAGPYEIIVLDRGTIVQRGTHEELAQAEGHYRRVISTL